MKNSAFHLRGERAGDALVIEALLNHAFGPGRHALTANRLREGGAQIGTLAVVAERSGSGEPGLPRPLLGSVRFSPVQIGGGAGALLLGPLVVHPEFRNHGCGIALVRRGLELARARAEALVFLVGDLPYYSRAGFKPVPQGQVNLPGPVDPRRLLCAELTPGALAGAAGMMAPG
ncbi:MAG: GNAT family N-acetyltransferase [Alphaproteobacteria bacterium]